MAMVLPGDYPERVVLPFAMDVIGRVKGKVRFCPPPEPEPGRAATADQEQDEDERAIADILARHLGDDAPPVHSPAPGFASSVSDAGPAGEHATGVACSLYAAPGGVAGRLVDVIIEGGGVAVDGPGGAKNAAPNAPRPASRGHCGAWTLEGVEIRNAPSDGLLLSGGSHVTVRDCSVGACGGRGCVVVDHAALVASNTDWTDQRGGTVYAGDTADLSLSRCNLDGPVPPSTAKPSEEPLPQVPTLSLQTFLAFKRYVRRVRWRTRNLVGPESCQNGHGVMLFGEARLRMENCFVRRAPGGGIVASQSSRCKVISSEVLQSGEEGVFASGHARLELKKVTVADARHSGCLLVENATATMTDCTVQQCRGVGILATGGSQLTAQDCTVTRNDCDGVRAKGHSSLTLTGCISRANGLEAVHMASYGPCSITANQLLGTVWTNAPPEGTQEQTWLRNTILAAIEDGDVDSKELGKIMRCLKNAKVDEETQQLVKVALEDGEMDEDDKALLLSICPKPTITTTDWHPRDGGRGSEKLEAGLRRERTSTDLLGGQGQGPSGGQPTADTAVAIDPLTRALHRMVTEDPSVVQAAAAMAAADAADAAAAAAEQMEQMVAAGGEGQQPPPQDGGAPAVEQVQFVREKSAAEIQDEMEERSRPMAAIWGNLDPRTQRRAISR